MYNGYRPPSSPPPIPPPPPIQSSSQQQGFGVQVSGHIQRSDQNQTAGGRQPSIPVRSGTLAPLLTQRLDLNWQQDWNSGEAPYTVNPDEFYRRVPVASVGVPQPLYSPLSQPSIATAPASTSSFYTFSMQNVPPVPEFTSPNTYSPPFNPPRVSSASHVLASESSSQLRMNLLSIYGR